MLLSLTSQFFKLVFFFILIFSHSVIAKNNGNGGGGGGGGSNLTSINCSTDKYKAKINEINLGSGQFIEIYFINTITSSNWDICYLNSSGSEVCSSTSSRTPSNGSHSSGSYTVFTLSSDMDKKDGEILLKDSNGDAIDSLTYCNGSSCTSALWDFNSSCTTTYTNHAVGQTDIYREPDGTGVFNNNKTTTEGCSNSGCSGGGGSSDTAASTFNCVENGANGISGKLYTKTTSQSFSFDIIALRDASTIETDFSTGADHTVTVELVNATTSANCADYPALSPTVSQSLTFTASDSGKKATTTMTSGKAYKKVKCRVTDPTDTPSNPIKGCSTDSFTIRPPGFSSVSFKTLSDSALNNTTAPATSSSVDSGTKVNAGREFKITASTGVTGYSGKPIYSTTLKDHNNIDQLNKLSGDFSNANEPTTDATGSDFKYKEVGFLKFAVNDIYDDSFTELAEDKQDGDCISSGSENEIFSDTVNSDGKIGCNFGNTSAYTIGRFIPDYFDVSLNSPEFVPGCGSFTYIGQPVKYYKDPASSLEYNPVATLTAKNAQGETTQNYKGSFWRINPAGSTPTYTVANHSLTVLESDAPSDSDGGNGSGTLTFANTTSNILAVTKSTLTAPFNAEIALSFTLSDSDGIVVANVNSTPQVNPVIFGATTSGNGINFSNKAHRWGRVALHNVHGSELASLSMPLTTEYYDGKNFIINTADSCTSFTLANDFSISDADGNNLNCVFAPQSTPVSIGSAGSVKASMNTSTVNNGITNLIISDNNNTANGPGDGNTGYVDITTSLTSLSWLQHDWDNDSIHDNCPSARATFGIYKGNSKQIYFREIY